AASVTAVAAGLSLGQVQHAGPRRRPADRVLHGQLRRQGSAVMKAAIKWTLITLGIVAVCAFGAFLYFIPPFFTTPPETFGKAAADAAPGVAAIADPAERAVAARGRYIVMTSGCIGCHATNG